MGNAQLKQEFDVNNEFADELTAGSTLMHGQYTIERFLNAGGFGITYEARDSLDRRVVIKECFPGAFCRRSTALVTARSRAHQKELGSIVRLFVQEARSLAKLNHPNIVGVHQVFEENNTAYMALDFVEGRDLLELIEDPADNLTPDETESVLRQVLDAISFIHDQGILHRDISPDNILLDQDKNPVLIDFGAAREQATKQSRVLSALRVVKDGYSPQEFYIAGSEQGPYSDLYALGASFYHLLTNDLPPNSQARLAAVAGGESDPYVPVLGRIEGYKDGFLSALDQSLAILPKDRIESAQVWVDMMDGVAPTRAAAPTPADAVEPAPAAKSSEPEKKKSGKGLLLATVAVVGLVAAGVATQTDLLDGVATGPAVETAEAVETPAPVTAPEPVQTPQVAEAPAAIAEPTPEVTPQPGPEVIVAETTEVAPEPTPEPAPAVVAEVETPAPFPLVEGETDVAPPAVTPGPIDFAANAAAIEAEQAALEAEALAEAEIVAEPEVVPAPDFLAGAPELATAPQPAETTDLASVAAAVSPARSPLPDATLLLSEADTGVPVETFQAGPPVSTQSDVGAFNLAEAGTQTEIDLPDRPTLGGSAWTGSRVTPVGLPQPTQDVVGAVDTTPASLPEPKQESVLKVAGLESSWTVRLPYEGLIGASEGETRIFSVNGVEVYSLHAFNEAVRRTMGAPRGGEAELELLIGTSRATAELKTLNLPVVQSTELESGLAFDTLFEGDKWVTRVANVPAEMQVDMQEGDVIYGHLATGEILADRTVMANILARGRLEGETVFNFAVKRGDTSWFANFSFSGS